MATKKVPIEIEGTDPTMVGWQTGATTGGIDPYTGRDGWDGISQRTRP
jgi:hypothetical protein